MCWRLLLVLFENLLCKFWRYGAECGDFFRQQLHICRRKLAVDERSCFLAEYGHEDRSFAHASQGWSGAGHGYCAPSCIQDWTKRPVAAGSLFALSASWRCRPKARRCASETSPGSPTSSPAAVSALIWAAVRS